MVIAASSTILATEIKVQNLTISIQSSNRINMHARKLLVTKRDTLTCQFSGRMGNLVHPILRNTRRHNKFQGWERSYHGKKFHVKSYVSNLYYCSRRKEASDTTLTIKSQKLLPISQSAINLGQQSDHIHNNQISSHHLSVRDTVSSPSFGYIPSKL